MREALGGSLLLNLVLVFAGLVIAFFVGILSYSKAYRVKNRIIELIEKHEVYKENIAINEINPDLNNAGYLANSPTKCDSIQDNLVENKYNGNYLSDNLNKNYGYNYCVFEVCDEKDENGNCIARNGKYYVVVTFIHFEVPVIGDILTFPVYGETKMLDKNYEY